MNKFLIVLGLFTLSSCISIKINSDHLADGYYSSVKNSNVTAVGTFFEEGNRGKDWSNENRSNSTKANFSDATNTSLIKLSVEENVELKFHHKVNLSGRMVFKIVDGKNQMIYARDLSDSLEEQFVLPLVKGEYKVLWELKSASGSYFLEWKEQ